MKYHNEIDTCPKGALLKHVNELQHGGVIETLEKRTAAQGIKLSVQIGQNVVAQGTLKDRAGDSDYDGTVAFGTKAAVARLPLPKP